MEPVNELEQLRAERGTMFARQEMADELWRAAVRMVEDDDDNAFAELERAVEAYRIARTLS